MDNKVGISAPWLSYARKINALFSQDPQIKVVFDEDSLILKLYVDDDVKADALMKLLPEEKSFGNVSLKIAIIPANKETSLPNLFQRAFTGNPIFRGLYGTPNIFTNTIFYLAFKNEVVQYFNDNLGDMHGLESALYEDLAREIFAEKDDGIYFCTDLPDGEEQVPHWP